MNIPTGIKGIETLSLNSFQPETANIGNPPGSVKGAYGKLTSFGQKTGDERKEYVKSLEDDLILNDQEIMNLNKRIGMLEDEIDRQSTIIDALIKAIKVIERG